MGVSELNEHMVEGLVGRAENVGDAKGASWSTVFVVVWEFIRMLAGK